MGERTISRRNFLAGITATGALAAAGALAGCAPQAQAEGGKSGKAAADAQGSWRDKPDMPADIAETLEADLVGVGAGNGGLVAATTAARASTAAAPASETASLLPLRARKSAWSMTSAHVRMMISGTSHAGPSASCSAACFAAASSGVAFGMRYDAAKGSNACASDSMSASSLLRRSASRSRVARTSSSTAAYVFLPTVRLPTMDASADATAPT